MFNAIQLGGYVQDQGDHKLHELSGQGEEDPSHLPEGGENDVMDAGSLRITDTRSERSNRPGIYNG